MLSHCLLRSVELSPSTFSTELDVSECTTLKSPFSSPAGGKYQTLHFQTGHPGQHLIHNSKILFRQTHRTRRSQRLIASANCRPWHIKFPPHLNRQRPIFLQHINMQPPLIPRLYHHCCTIS